MRRAGQRVAVGGGRVRRLLSRALLVAGATAAGTIAAWLLGSGSALADSELSLGSLDIDRSTDHCSIVDDAEILDAEDTSCAAHLATGESGETERSLAETMAGVTHLRHGATPNIDDLSGLRSVVVDLTEVLGPKQSELGSSTVLGTLTTPQSSRDTIGTTHSVAGQRSGEAISTSSLASSGVDVSDPARTSPPRAINGESRDVATQPADQPTVPLLPFRTPLTPVIPLSGPSAPCNCSGEGTGSIGGSAVAGYEPATALLNTAVARATAPAAYRVAIGTAQQPGVKPD